MNTTVTNQLDAQSAPQSRNPVSSFKLQIMALALLLFVVSASLSGWYGYTTQLHAMADVSAAGVSRIAILLIAAVGTALFVQGNSFFIDMVWKIPSLREYVSYDEERHRRVYKAMLFRSSKASTRQSLTLLAMFLVIYLLAGSLSGFAFGLALREGSQALLIWAGCVIVVYFASKLFAKLDAE